MGGHRARHLGHAAGRRGRKPSCRGGRLSPAAGQGQPPARCPEPPRRHLCGVEHCAHRGVGTGPLVIRAPPARRDRGIDRSGVAWRTPYSSRVDSLTNFNRTRALGDDLVVEPLVEEAASLDDDDLARIERIARNEPDLVGRLVSRDGRVGALAISFVRSGNQGAMVAEVPDYLDGVLADARSRYPELDFHLTGNIIFNRTVNDAVAEGVRSTLPHRPLLPEGGTGSHASRCCRA